MSAKGRRMRAWITNIALLLVLAVLAVFATKAGAEWVGVRKERTDLLAEQKKLEDDNALMHPLHDDVMGSDGVGKFVKICNPGEDPAEITWVHAVYPSGDHVAAFDSAQCTGWKNQSIEGGKSAQLALNSAQPGCNWNGQVVFYAMTYVIHRPTVDAQATVAGPWIFQGDCFTLPR